MMPPPPMPPAGGAGAPPGAAPMGGPPMPPGIGPGPAPQGTQNMAMTNEETGRVELSTPLSSQDKLLYDAEDLIDEAGGSRPEDVAMKVWQAYGGTNQGDVDPSKTGKRRPADPSDPLSVEQKKEMYDSTKDKRWERLPIGKNIGDVVDYGTLYKLIQGMIASEARTQAKQSNQGAQGGPGGGGGAPPLGASHALRWLRMARTLEAEGEPYAADECDRRFASLIARIASGIFNSR